MKQFPNCFEPGIFLVLNLVHGNWIHISLRHLLCYSSKPAMILTPTQKCCQQQSWISLNTFSNMGRKKIYNILSFQDKPYGWTVSKSLTQNYNVNISVSGMLVSLNSIQKMFNKYLYLYCSCYI